MKAPDAGGESSRSFVELPGRGRVSYLTSEGAAERTTLLIHGSGVSARSWVYQLRGLRGALRMMAVDLPGHGESDPALDVSVEEYAAVVTDFLTVLDTGPVIVAGHTLGGAIAIALAAKRPDLVRGLVLVSSCVKLPPADGWGERLIPYLPGPLRKLLFFSTAKKILFAPGASGEAVRLAMQELRACRPQTILNDVRAARTMDLTEPAGRLDVPTLILAGGRDGLIPPASAQRLRELIRGSRLRIADGAGHMMLLESPDWVNQEFVTFADSLDRLAPSAAAAGTRRERSLARRVLDWFSDIARRLLRDGRRLGALLT